MKSVVLFQPIDKLLLDEIFVSSAVELSFRRSEFVPGAYMLEMRDTRILDKYNQPHSVINFTDMKEAIEKKRIRTELESHGQWSL